MLPISIDMIWEKIFLCYRFFFNSNLTLSLNQKDFIIKKRVFLSKRFMKNVKNSSVENSYLFINTSTWKSFFPVKRCDRLSDKLLFLHLYNAIPHINNEEGKKNLQVKFWINSLVVAISKAGMRTLLIRLARLLVM